MDVYDHVVLGDGPISRTLVQFLNRDTHKKILIIDAGQLIQDLSSNITVDSNIEYLNVNQFHSFHVSEPNHVWYGSCEKISGYHFFHTMNLQKTEKNIRNFNEVATLLARDLKIVQDDGRHSLPDTASLKSGIVTHASTISSSKILSDATLSQISQENLRSPSNEYVNSIVIFKIIRHTFFIELAGIDSTGCQVNFRGRRIHLALGTIENTRLLLNSAENLSLEESQFLGKFLSDHLSVDFGNMYTENLAPILHAFSRRKGYGGIIFWPRLRLGDYDSEDFFENPFAHVTHVKFRKGETLPYRTLRKLHREDLYSKNAEGTFRVRLLFEKQNDENNRMQLIRSWTDAVPPLYISFDVHQSELIEINAQTKNLVNEFYRRFGSRISESFLNDYPEHIDVGDIRTAIHPSGTYRMSNSPSDGLINLNSELWTDDRIRVLGSGAFFRSGAFHPTFSAMVLARQGAR